MIGSIITGIIGAVPIGVTLLAIAAGVILFKFGVINRFGVQKKNNSIFLLVDQKDSAGEEVILFNKSIKTQTGFLKIARK